LNDILAVFN
jgi:hypothetical protein